ncbi:MAG: hypothetical protein IPM29_20525 [Planctomycetes bacterium]|nr:hypothetical protein [Planctomycetota bacterium]
MLGRHGLTILALLSLGAAVPSQAAPRTDQEVTRTGITDHGYLFELRAPAGWQLLGESEARRLSPDAMCGATLLRSGIWAFLITESTSEVELSDMRDLVIANMLDRLDGRVEQTDEIEFLGRPAFRVHLVGEVDGVKLRFVNTLFQHRSYTYQIVCAGPDLAPMRDPRTTAAICDAFTLLPGDAVPGRDRAWVRSDTTGIGWRLTGGRYESALSGVVIEPREGWHVEIGDALAAMNADAEVALLHGRVEFYLMIVSEPVAAADRNGFEPLLRESCTVGLGAAPSGSFTRPVAGRDVRFDIRTLDVGAEHVHGVMHHEGFVVQIQCWWTAAAGDGALQLLDEALAQLSFLDGERKARLARELLDGQDHESGLLADRALRNGLFRDYRYDFRWRKPRDTFWRVRLGQDARAFDEQARAVLEAPAHGIEALVFAEQGSDVAPLHYHRATLADYVGRDSVTLLQKPRTRSVGGRQVLLSSFSVDRGDIRMGGLLATASQPDGRHVAMVFMALPQNLRDGRDAALAAVDSLELLDFDLEPSQRAAGVIRDDRLGFELRAPSQTDAMEEQSIPAFESQGRVIRIGGGPHVALFTAVRSNMQSGQSEWFERVLHENMARSLPREFRSVGLQEVGEVTVDGRTGRHRRGAPSRSGGRIETVTLEHDGTFFALVVAHANGRGPTLEQYLAGIRWVE